MRLLITGICGFVGSTLAEALLEQNESKSFEITGIDNFSRSGSWLNRDRLVGQGVKILHGDIRSATDLELLGPFDWVIDAAANPSVLAGVDGKSSSRQLVEHNLSGTINLLEACKRWGSGFILLSTSRVYSIKSLASLKLKINEGAYEPVLGSGEDDITGLSSNGISETFSTTPPISLYGVTKLTSESLALEYGMTFDFPVWINRCGVLAGAGQFGKPDQGIFSFWIHSWREGRPLRYMGFDGLGHQVRDCLHPKDIATLIMKQVSSSYASGKVPTVNLSGGLESAMSLRQLSEWCAQRFPYSPTASSLLSDPFRLTTIRPFDLPWVVLDSSLANRTWDWHSTIPIISILEEIANFADANPKWIATSA